MLSEARQTYRKIRYYQKNEIDFLYFTFPDVSIDDDANKEPNILINAYQLFDTRTYVRYIQVFNQKIY